MTLIPLEILGFMATLSHLCCIPVALPGNHCSFHNLTVLQNHRVICYPFSYFLANAGSEGLAGAAGDRFRETAGGGNDNQGLARLEGDRLLMSNADESGDLVQLGRASPQLLAPEIGSLQFQYFDGTDLAGGLGTVIEYGTVPQAIKVTRRLSK